MAYKATSASAWAKARIGKFFTSDGNTGNSGYLDGQCTSLTKWFMHEMTQVPNPFVGRGHAKYIGDTLVAQGHAKIVKTPMAGDIVIWKNDGGGYGHIGVMINSSQVFEENVALPGRKSKIVYGMTVYASGIANLYESWRAGSPTFYRLNSYLKGVVKNTEKNGYAKGGTILKPGQSIKTQNGTRWLIHQTDGNVVLYKKSRNKKVALWSTKTARRKTTRFVMQTDGNLVLYNGKKAIWASHTNRNKGAYLAVQSDSNLVIYNKKGKAIWSSKTAGK